MDEGDERKAADLELDPSSKNILPKASSACPEDERDADQRNGVGRKSEKVKNRSVSRSPQRRRRSISSDRMCPSSRRRSLTPRSRHSPWSSRSPARRQLSYSRQRSRSRSLQRSPSPVRRRLHSPYRRRSPTPVRRRFRSPITHRRSPSPNRCHRSPLLFRCRRSPSPVRRRRSRSPRHRRSRSPVHRSSPSLIRRRSPLPVRCTSPSPLQRRSPSPAQKRRHRSPSTPRHRSSSLARRRSPSSSRSSITPSNGKSPSPYQSSSLSPVQRRSSSPDRRSLKERRSPLLSPRERQRMHVKLSPVGRRPSSVKSPNRDLMDQRDAGDKGPALSPFQNKSTVSKSPSHVRYRSASEDRRSSSPYESPMRQRREQIAHDDSLSREWKRRELKDQRDSQGTGIKNEADRSRHSLAVTKQRVSPRKVHTPEQLAGSRSTESRSRLDNIESRKKELEMKSERSSGKGVRLGTPDRQRSPAYSEDSFHGEKQSASHLREGKRSGDRSRSRQNNLKESDEHDKAEISAMLLEKVDHNNHGVDSGSEGSDKRRTKHKEKGKHKRSERREVTSDDDSSSDSDIEDRKEAKRRRKEEKRLRKEEKRRRREERRHRREERIADKLKNKGQHDDSNSDGEHAARRKSLPSDDEEAETEQKQLVIELRKKALESLKAKKGISH